MTPHVSRPGAYSRPLALGSGLLLLATLGCSTSLQVRRAESATVVNASTGAPLVGAAIVVESWQVVTPSGHKFERKDVYSTLTDSQGRFDVPGLMQLFHVLPIPDMVPAFNRRICVSAKGYHVALADPWAGSQSQPWQFEFPQVYKLTPAQTGYIEECPFGLEAAGRTTTR